MARKEAAPVGFPPFSDCRPQAGRRLLAGWQTSNTTASSTFEMISKAIERMDKASYALKALSPAALGVALVLIDKRVPAWLAFGAAAIAIIIYCGSTPPTSAERGVSGACTAGCVRAR